MYAFPPVPLIPLTLEKIRQDGCRAITILPMWRNAKWWDILLELLLDDPLPLGDHKDVFVPLSHHKLPHLGTIVACRLGRASPY